MYCALTGQLIGVGVHAVKKHMEGKRFQKAKGTDTPLAISCTQISMVASVSEAFMQGSLKLKPEPDIPDIIVRPCLHRR